MAQANSPTNHNSQNWFSRILTSLSSILSFKNDCCQSRVEESHMVVTNEPVNNSGSLPRVVSQGPEGESERKFTTEFTPPPQYGRVPRKVANFVGNEEDGRSVGRNDLKKLHDELFENTAPLATRKSYTPASSPQPLAQKSSTQDGMFIG